MTEYRPITVEGAMQVAEQAEADGYPEVGASFRRIAEKIAWFNEHNKLTVEELRQKVGDEMFFKLLNGDLEDG
jgi:rubrerythrin